LTDERYPGLACRRPTDLQRKRTPPNDAMQLTAPLGGRDGNGVVDAAASRSPFGERRRRS